MPVDMLPFTLTMNPRNAKLFQRLYTNMMAIGETNNKGQVEVKLRIDDDRDLKAVFAIGKMIGTITFADPMEEPSLN